MFKQILAGVVGFILGISSLFIIGNPVKQKVAIIEQNEIIIELEEDILDLIIRPESSKGRKAGIPK